MSKGKHASFWDLWADLDLQFHTPSRKAEAVAFDEGQSKEAAHGKDVGTLLFHPLHYAGQGNATYEMKWRPHLPCSVPPVAPDEVADLQRLSQKMWVIKAIAETLIESEPCASLVVVG